MARIKNENLDILKDIESYLFNVNMDCFDYIDDKNFVVKTNNVKDKVALELYFKLYGIIEEIENSRKEENKKVSDYHKTDKKLHNIKSNIYYAKKKNNLERLSYWQNELELYLNNKN